MRQDANLIALRQMGVFWATGAADAVRPELARLSSAERYIVAAEVARVRFERGEVVSINEVAKQLDEEAK